ncbi:MAG: B12-binding domain-containing radical SAM protein [Deltaproteobacteria bacterium]|nr:B12-binding domain-containing radical SAM protein [Deltaproteobacteria bacterium]
MKICLINPPTTDPSERNVYFPMALLTLGGVLKKMEVEADLWDFDLFFKRSGNLTEAAFGKILRAGVLGSGTDLFAISSICSNFPMAIYIAKQIKEFKPNAYVVMGGAQPSSVPQETLERFPFIDMVVAGEGEVTLRRLIEVEFDPSKFEGIPGLFYRENGGIKINPKRELVPDMDDLPLPDYSLINFSDYIEAQHGRFMPCLEVGRGCPFHCTFCSTSLMWEKDFRVKSSRRIVEEMNLLNRDHGFSDFNFIHDNFTTSRKFVLDFCDYLEKSGTQQFRWSVSSRTDCIDTRRLQTTHQVGLRGLFFGIETGSAKMQAVIKKNLDFNHFEPIIQEGNRLGIGSTTAFILGFPEEDVDDMDATFLRALHYRLVGTERVFFSKLAALTGTSLYRDNLGKFGEMSQTSTINPQNYGIQYVRDIIRDYPSLFSSFYHVPHEKFSADYLVRFVEFANLAVNGNPKFVSRVLETLEWTPTQLFKRWDQWAEAGSILYCDYRQYSPELFREDFGRFMEAEFFSRIKSRDSFSKWEILGNRRDLSSIPGAQFQAVNNPSSQNHPN